MRKVRTTIRLDAELHRSAKRVALEIGKSFQELVEDGLKTAVVRTRKPKRSIKLKTYNMGVIKTRLDRATIYSDLK